MRSSNHEVLLTLPRTDEGFAEAKRLIADEQVRPAKAIDGRDLDILSRHELDEDPRFTELYLQNGANPNDEHWPTLIEGIKKTFAQNTADAGVSIDNQLTFQLQMLEKYGGLPLTRVGYDLDVNRLRLYLAFNADPFRSNRHGKTVFDAVADSPYNSEFNQAAFDEATKILAPFKETTLYTELTPKLRVC